LTRDNFSRVLRSTRFDIYRIVHFFSIDCKIAKKNVAREKVINPSPYRAYAVDLARKRAPFSNAEIGRYRGGFTHNAATRIGTRFEERVRDKERPRDGVEALNKNCSVSRANPVHHSLLEKCLTTGLPDVACGNRGDEGMIIKMVSNLNGCDLLRPTAQCPFWDL